MEQTEFMKMKPQSPVMMDGNIQMDPGISQSNAMQAECGIQQHQTARVSSSSFEFQFLTCLIL